MMARQDSKTISLAQPDPAVEEPAPDLAGRRKSKTISLAQPDAAVVEEPVPELLGRRKRPEVGQFRLLHVRRGQRDVVHDVIQVRRGDQQSVGPRRAADRVCLIRTLE